jgi:hypothetical protein
LVTYSTTRNDGARAIRGAFMQADGSILANDFDIANFSAGQDGATVASNGTDFLVAWTRHGDELVYGARITGAGAVGAPVPISTVPGSNPSAAWSGTNYLVAWEDGRSGTSIDVYGTLVTGAGQVVASVAGGIPISTAINTQGTPVAAGDGSGFLVLWADQRAGAGKFDVYGSRLTANGILEDQTGFPVAVSANAESAPAIAQGSSGSHLATYQRFSTEAPYNGLDRVYSRPIAPS